MKIKLVTGDTWSPSKAVDYHRNLEGGLNLVDESGVIVASVAQGQWVYVEIPPEQTS